MASLKKLKNFRYLEFKSESSKGTQGCAPEARPNAKRQQTKLI
jgi:hypothetical protein